MQTTYNMTSFDPKTHTVVDDGQTLSLYAYPHAELLDSLNAIKTDPNDYYGEPYGYSLWCADHEPILTTGTGDDPMEIIAIAEANAIPTIYYDESGSAWLR